MEIKKKNFILAFIIVAGILLASFFVFAQGVEDVIDQTDGTGEIVSVGETTVCCEKTLSGLSCLDVRADQCNPDARQLPTSCESSSFCNPGYCFDSEEGFCYDNTPQIVCNEKGGTWTAEKPAQCNLGCCILGDSGSFVTLTRCKAMSALYGLETNFNPNVESEAACTTIASSQERGACVYVDNPAEAQPTCKMTTRAECTPELVGVGSDQAEENTDESKNEETSDVVVNNENQQTPTENSGDSSTTSEEENSGEETDSNNGNIGDAITGNAIASAQTVTEEVKFYPGRLCTDEALGTNCAPTKDTLCLPGKEEVYFVDTCGNPSNIYDAARVNDNSYWNQIINKQDACRPGDDNINSATCGNCNYLLGSYCRTATEGNPRYGDYMCADLNCVDNEGEERLHGESWCEFDAVPQIGTGRNPVGSKFYRYQCNNGKIIVEPCADFRQEECLQDTIETAKGKFSQAACRVNRWQDCTNQKEPLECLNSDKRDCIWLQGIEYVLVGALVGTDAEGNSSTVEVNSLPAMQQAIKQAGGLKNIPRGACVPKNPPGLQFWDGDEAKAVCAQANVVCPVTYQKGLLEDSWECIENCECLDQTVQLKRAQVCMALGDCGPNVNYIGQRGNNKGYKITEEELDDEE